MLGHVLTRLVREVLDSIRIGLVLSLLTLGTWTPLFMGLGVATYDAWAAGGDEAACIALGGNCICNIKFDDATYQKAGSDHWRPTNWATVSASKRCQVEGVAAYMIASSLTLTNAGVNSGEAWTTLPVGHSVERVLQFPMDYDDSVFYGNEAHVQQPGRKRIAARWYVHHTRNGGGFFDFAGENGCTASKLGELGASTLLEHSQGTIVHLRAMQNWVPEIDCCGSGDFTTPGPGPGDIPSANAAGRDWWPGHWFRVQIAVVNPSGTSGGPFDVNNSTRIFVRIKRMGDAIEYEPVNTLDYNTWSPSESVGWDNTINHQPWQPVDQLRGDNFRSKTSGTCRGTYSVSHYMMAGWDTDADQWIGAATEFEGGGGDPPAEPVRFRSNLNLRANYVEKDAHTDVMPLP